MTDHLPECPDTEQCVYDDNDQCWIEHSQCICEELRACERRVLDAARDAVAGLLNWSEGDLGLICNWNSACAAIDALRGES